MSHGITLPARQEAELALVLAARQFTNFGYHSSVRALQTSPAQRWRSGTQQFLVVITVTDGPALLVTGKKTDVNEGFQLLGTQFSYLSFSASFDTCMLLCFASGDILLLGWSFSHWCKKSEKKSIFLSVWMGLLLGDPRFVIEMFPSTDCSFCWTSTS